MKLNDFINFVRNTGYEGNLNIFTRDGQKVPSYEIDCVMKKDVVKYEVCAEIHNIYVDIQVPDVYDEDTKFYWKVWQSAVDCTDGYVLLTKKEAEIVFYATNQDNWKHLNEESWSGCFSIDLDNPISEEDFENGRV